MIKEFKEFIERGNVVDLAVAVVIGAAFGVVVKSFTDNVLMRIIGILGGSPQFAGHLAHEKIHRLPFHAVAAILLRLQYHLGCSTK